MSRNKKNDIRLSAPMSISLLSSRLVCHAIRRDQTARERGEVRNVEVFILIDHRTWNQREKCLLLLLQLAWKSMSWHQITFTPNTEVEKLDFLRGSHFLLSLSRPFVRIGENSKREYTSTTFYWWSTMPFSTFNCLFKWFSFAFLSHCFFLSFSLSLLRFPAEA